MIGPPGWFPDPSGASRLRYFDGWVWTDWVSAGGLVSAVPLERPSTGGGTLVTEPVLVTGPAGASSLRVTTPAGLELAHAVDPDGQGRRLEVADATGGVVLVLRRTGLAATASVVVGLSGPDGSSELGRFERGRPGEVRVMTRGALAALVAVPEAGRGPFDIVDPGGLQVGRIRRDQGTWTTELARPLGDPLHPLVALAALAVELIEPSDLLRRASQPSS